MDNSVVNFKKENIDGFEISDYRSKDFSKFKEIQKDQFKSLDVFNNSLIEGISYNIFNNTDYWDLLLLINDKDALFDMVYDFDTIKDIVEESIQSYFFNPERIYQGNLNDEFIEGYRNYLETVLSNQNFFHSKLKVINKNIINKFIEEKLIIN